MSELSCSIIIPWANRDEVSSSIEAAQSLMNEQAIRHEFIVSNCAGDGVRLEQLLAASGLTANVIVSKRNIFNKAHALNLGLARARSEFVFFLDADVCLKHFPFVEAAEHARRGDVITLSRVFESDGSVHSLPESCITFIGNVSEITLADGRSAAVRTNRVDLRDGSRAAPGIVFARRETFLAVGGMHSDLEGWGWEDIDLIFRLAFVKNAVRHELGDGIHLSHADRGRALHGLTRGQSEHRNFQRAMANYANGNFFGTYDRDIVDGLPIIEVEASE